MSAPLLSTAEFAAFAAACADQPVLARDFAVSIAIAEGRIPEGDVAAASQVAAEAIAKSNADTAAFMLAHAEKRRAALVQTCFAIAAAGAPAQRRA